MVTPLYKWICPSKTMNNTYKTHCFFRGKTSILMLCGPFGQLYIHTRTSVRAAGTRWNSRGGTSGTHGPFRAEHAAYRSGQEWNQQGGDGYTMATSHGCKRFGLPKREPKRIHLDRVLAVSTPLVDAAYNGPCVDVEGGGFRKQFGRIDSSELQSFQFQSATTDRGEKNPMNRRDGSM